MDPVVRNLLTPGPAEIIRASQKDVEFIGKLNNEIQEVTQSIFGQRTSHKWHQALIKISELLYHSLTNLTGHQTLGEEYCGILQVDQSASQTPRKVRLASMIFFATFGHSTLEFVLKLLEQYLSKIQAQQQLSSFSRGGGSQEDEEQSAVINRNLKSSERMTTYQMGETGIEVVRVIKNYLPFLGQLHLALFYLQGNFYHFSKRLLGIYYLLVRKSFANQDENSRQTLKYLMVISIINSFLTGVSDSVSFFKSKKPVQERSNIGGDYTTIKVSADSEGEIDPSKRCTLCLDKRSNSSLTPCGHLFCWDCIIDWLRSKQECPICREQFSPSRVVPLQNYN